MYELMKQTPYLGTFPYPLVSWKGKTLKQITTTIRENGKVNPSLTIRNDNLFRAGPLKLYRREIVSSPTDSCNVRTSTRIDEFDRPGGSIINSSATVQNGLVNTLDDNFPKNTCERPGTCLKILSAADNAKRRVRSSGMIKRQFDISKIMILIVRLRNNIWLVVIGRFSKINIILFAKVIQLLRLEVV